MHQDLPIYSAQADLCKAWRPGARIVLGAPPGAGKSTQVPQILLNAGFIPAGQKLIVLEPRRLATKLVAARVAQEIGESLGVTVGYQIRFERVASASTRILFVTEGVLVRMMLEDPQLRTVAGIIFDEFHERHLASDLSLAWAKRLQLLHRRDLVLLVMSATLHTEPLMNYLAPAECLEVSGRAFPVSVCYSPVKPNVPIWEAAAEAWLKNIAQTDSGDCLIFMPSVYAIERTLQAIRAYPQSRRWASCALHAQLSAELQEAALAPQAQRKIIVSTNVAETSVTIDGIRWVIDSGLARIERYDPRRDISVLLVDKISQASAEQRAGRSGRQGPGTAIRLWAERDHPYRAKHEAPEIARVDLSEMLLAVKAGGIDPQSLEWLDA
ncbi:MAG TPA: helicase-related protein [Opitutales bacterium]|nr:helicase-related protein [Opitutales bacterium]